MIIFIADEGNRPRVGDQMVSFIDDGAASNKPILTKGAFERIARNHRIFLNVIKYI